MLNIDLVGVMIFDGSGTLVEANDAFLKMSGYTREQVAARALHWRTLTPPEFIDESERQMGQLAATGRLGPYEKEYLRRDGSRSWMLFAGADLGDGTVVEYAIDITDKKRAEEALRMSEERLRLALLAARMGIWTWDVAADIQTRDAYLNGLLGLEPVESSQTLAEFVDHTHPDDRATVSAAFASSVEQGGLLNIEFRVVWPDGAVRWLRDQGDIFGTTPGGSPHMTGACVDITEVKETEAALRASEERLRLVITSATDYAIFTLDSDRRITGWSPGAEAVFGYTEAEVLGRPVDLFFTPEDRAAGAPEAEVQAALREGRAGDERWHVRKDGSRFFASGVLTRLGDDGPLGLVKVLRDLTERKEMEDALREARDALEARVAERTAELTQANHARAELVRRLVRAQEDERRRVSRELHDGLGQELTALILGLKALEGTIPEGSPGRDRLREVEASVGRIGREAHDLAVELRPTALDDIGLDAALATYVARWSERTGVAADFQALGPDGRRLPPEVETAIYRVVQEALNNTARHAGASRVSIILERRGDAVTALVEDDGQGFDPAPVVESGAEARLGLLGMRERIALVGGSLLLESGEGEGTTLRARIPLEMTSGEPGHGD
jgi:PAS domain S-box-containing protein